MALFLETTSYSSSRHQGDLADVAIEGIFLMQEEMQLMEAIYQADFIMHEQNKNLSESTRVLKEGNFLVNVYRKIIEWMKKAWQWVKDFFSKIKDKVVEIYNRIKDHLTDNTASRANSVLEKAKLKMDKAYDFLTFAKRAGKVNSVEEAKKLVEGWKKTVEAYAKKATAAEKIKGSSMVSMTFINKLKDLPGELAKEANDVFEDLITTCTEKEAELEKTGTDTEANKDINLNNKEAQELIHAKRMIATEFKTGAVGCASDLVTQLGAMIVASKADKTKATGIKSRGHGTDGVTKAAGSGTDGHGAYA